MRRLQQKKDWKRKIKEINCGKVTAERRKIYVENYEKTTENKIRNEYEEESLEVKKRQEVKQKNQNQSIEEK